MRAADYLAAENAVLVYRGGGREGNCMFKHAGVYYFCSSDLHGWNASQTYCVSATNINGPYGAEFVLGGVSTDVQSGLSTMCYAPGIETPERECWYINMGAVDRDFFDPNSMVRAGQ